ncbi:MAG: hypothetical protein M3362_14325 [Acidobacteriota bacterium]|nr:hypothetical protein [Acidobacteriota bacterium]
MEIYCLLYNTSQYYNLTMNNIHHFQGSESKQALRFLKPVPEDLAHLIYLANLVPPTPPLPKLNWGPGLRFIGELRDVDMSSIPTSVLPDDELFEQIVSHLQSFPVHVREYFESLATRVGKFPAAQHYDEIQEAQEKLRIAVALNRELEISKETKTPPPFRPFALPLQEMYLFIDEDGTFQVQWDHFAYAVKGVEAARIKQCANCQRFFWAGRIDQKCCNKKCSGAFRVRRFREAYAKDPAGYIQRRAARERAKS